MPQHNSSPSPEAVDPALYQSTLNSFASLLMSPQSEPLMSDESSAMNRGTGDNRVVGRKREFTVRSGALEGSLTLELLDEHAASYTYPGESPEKVATEREARGGVQLGSARVEINDSEYGPEYIATAYFYQQRAGYGTTEMLVELRSYSDDETLPIAEEHREDWLKFYNLLGLNPDLDMIDDDPNIAEIDYNNDEMEGLAATFSRLATLQGDELVL